MNLNDLILDDSVDNINNPEFEEIMDAIELEEAPTGNDEADKIQSAFTALEDLKYLFEDISNAKGMCKSLALEAERIIPGFLNEKKPLGYFTNAPTATMYRSSMEELDNKQIGIIGAAVAALIAFIVAVVKWFKKRKDNNVGERSEALVESTDAKVKIIDEGIKEVDKVAPHELHFEQIVKEISLSDTESACAKLVFNVPANIYELLQPNSAIVRSFKAVFVDGSFSSTIRALALSSHSLVDVVNRGSFDFTSTGDVIYKNYIKAIKDNKHKGISQDPDSLYTVRFEGSERTVKEVRDYIFQQIASIDNTETRKFHSFNEFINRYQGIKFDEFILESNKYQEELIKIMEDVEHNLNKVQIMLERQEQGKKNYQLQSFPHSQADYNKSMADIKGIELNSFNHADKMTEPGNSFRKEGVELDSDERKMLLKILHSMQAISSNILQILNACDKFIVQGLAEINHNLTKTVALVDNAILDAIANADGKKDENMLKNLAELKEIYQRVMVAKMREENKKRKGIIGSFFN